MKLIREETVMVGGSANDGGEVVVVGVKFDAESRELLTWALMKVAKSGDRVIAVHVLDSITEYVGGTASLLSLVQTFDSLLAVYEGFCNLKQVDLKLKVCRGSSARKILVREAKSNCAATLVVGTSKTHHTIRSSTSLAKYCARNLSKSISVLAVANGKIMFHREPTLHHLLHPLNQHKLKHNSSSSQFVLSDNLYLVEDTNEDGYVDNSLALVPIQTKLPRHKQGWSFLRRIFLPNSLHTKKTHVNKNSVVKLVFKLPTWNSSSIVYPDQKQTIGDNGATVPITASKVSWSSISPCHRSDGLPEELKYLYQKYSSSCRLFSYEELCLATSNFMPENMVGKGGSSHVYKGCLPDGKELAVKVLKPSKEVLKEFIAELEIITTLHHKNIISLLGFCFDHNNLLLVYDFLTRGSLEENLHGNKKDGNGFGWLERFKVALGVAEALNYLHNLSDQPVIHRDVKSSNILLSDDFEPQLSDFGLASWIWTSSAHINADVAGTFGYLAPEYFMHGKVSEKIDVFAFGVVLLELLSGKMPINGENLNGQKSLVMWAKPILEVGKVSQLLDPQIVGEYDDDHIERIFLAATLCIRLSPGIRPKINVILKLLQGDNEVMKWARQEAVDSSDGEIFASDIQSHLNIALLDLEDDYVSISSTERGITVEDYLRGRWSGTSSFD